GTALHRRDHRLRRRVLARPAPREDADDRPDVRLRRRGRGDLGADPGRPEGIRADERDHHVADAQLRRRAAAHVHDLRQRVAVARRLDGADALVPAVGRPAAEPVLARGPPGRRGDPVRVPARLRRRRGAVGALPADAVRLRDERHRRLAAGRALLRNADEAEDPRRDGDLRRRRRPGGRQPGRRLLARARRERPGASGRELRLHRDRRRRARPLQPDRRLPRRRAARRAPERRAVPPGCGLPERPRRRDAGDHPLLHARRRAADPLPRAAGPAGARRGDGACGGGRVNDSLVVQGLAQAVLYGTPILFAALGELLAERSGVLNLGVEGMMLVGATRGFWGMQRAPGPTSLVLLLAILTAAFAGLVLAAIHAYLVVTLRASQIVSGLALTIFAGGLGLSSYLGN